MDFLPSSGCWDLQEKLACLWRRVGKRHSGGKPGEKGPHVGAAGEAADMSPDKACVRQHREMARENYHMFLWVSSSPVFPDRKCPPVGPFNFVSLPS